MEQEIDHNGQSQGISTNDEPMQGIMREVLSTGGCINYAPTFVDQRQSHNHNYQVQNCHQPQIAGGDLIAHSPNQESTDASQERLLTTSGQEAAIEKMKRVQEKYNENSLVLLGLKTPQNGIPIVHPQMIEATVAEQNVPKREEYIPSSQKPNNIEYKDRIAFEEVIDKVKQSSFVSLIGLPGAGKTTMSRRISNKLDIKCFLLNFMDMNFDDDYKITLPQLLFNKYPELSDKERELIFHWIVENDEQCVFILEGYDQCKWSLRSDPSPLSCDTPQTIWNLVSNLCMKRYLPRSHILFTSRPHSMTYIPKTVKSDHTVLLQDMLHEDMKKLFFAFAGAKAQQVWDELYVTSPQLVSSCLNPLILQLVIKACLCSTSDVKEITTMTRVFAAVLDDLRVLEHTRHDDIKTLTRQLARLAYNATKKLTVMLTLQNLQAVGLDMKTAQDLVIARLTHRRGSCKVFEGETFLYFLHQTFQEYFTALYIRDLMSYYKFRMFIWKNLFSPHWSVVRRFLYGLLADVRNKTGNNSHRAQVAFHALIQKMKKNPESRVLIDICCDVREANNEAFTKRAAANFPNEAWLRYIPLSASDSHALSCVIRQIEKKINGLGLGNCRLNTESFRYLSDAISQMPGSIGMLNIYGNFLSSNSINDIIKILPKVNEVFRITDCFDNGADGWRSANDEEQGMIQLALNEIPSSNLKVIVDIRDGSDFILKKQS